MNNLLSKNTPSTHNVLGLEIKALQNQQDPNNFSVEQNGRGNLKNLKNLPVKQTVEVLNNLPVGQNGRSPEQPSCGTKVLRT